MHPAAADRRPKAMRCTSPPEAWSFPKQLHGEVLMAVKAWGNILFSLSFFGGGGGALIYDTKPSKSFFFLNG